MSLTITGGITLSSGGWTITAAPPAIPTSTAGWFSGGFDFGPVSATATVNRLTFATDTASSSTRGPLSLARYWLAGTGSTTAGWYAAGQTSSSPSTSRIDRITYATDTATATAVTTLGYPYNRLGMAASTDYSTYGWFGGGYVPSLGVDSSIVERLTYATDTSGTSARGPLAVGKAYLAATSTMTYGWFAGGRFPTVATVSRITYATDTATASTRGSLAAATYRFAATGNGNYAWFAGGPGLGSGVNRIDYANDTATATARGPLSSSRAGFAGASDGNNYGWYSGATAGKSDRIDYANDTATASIRGPLTSNTYLAATSGVQ